ELEGEGRRAIHPDFLPEREPSRYFSEDFQIDWVEAKDLLSDAGADVFLPASSTYLCWPTIAPFSSNGLASGNSLPEATLHALYEIVERDAIAGLSIDGKIRLSECAQVVSLETVCDEAVRALKERLQAAGLKLVLMWVRSAIPAHTFFAVILDP